MIAVDLDEGRVFHDSEIKDRIAGDADYAEMGADFMTIADLDDPAAPSPACPYDRAELARRQVAAGQTLEAMELILAPMVETAKERREERTGGKECVSTGRAGG